jgi:purine-nucleoside phosphorylase
MLRTIGADAVTMSTIPEVITANHRGMNVMGISCISNMGTGISGEKLDHNEVTQTAEKIQHNFIRLMDETITRFPD